MKFISGAILFTFLLVSVAFCASYLNKFGNVKDVQFFTSESAYPNTLWINIDGSYFWMNTATKPDEFKAIMALAIAAKQNGDVMMLNYDDSQPYPGQTAVKKIVGIYYKQ